MDHTPKEEKFIIVASNFSQLQKPQLQERAVMKEETLSLKENFSKVVIMKSKRNTMMEMKFSFEEKQLKKETI